MPQNYPSKMTEVRQSSSQQNQSVRWMKTLVGVILAGSLLFILFKELHSLSKGLEELTKSLKELSNRLTKEEKKNEKLRKELRRVKERMDNVLEEFSNMRQKVSRDKRAKDAHNGHGSKKSETRCKRLRHCAEKLVNADVNCTMVRNCMPSRGKDLIHAYTLLPSTLENAQAKPGKQSIKDDFTAQLSWQGYLSPSDSSIIAVSNTRFNISRGGIYYVYCHLRVGEQVNRIVIRTNSSELFSTLPKFTSNGIGVVRMSRLAKIPSYALLYVEVEFNSSFYKDTKNTQRMDVLFPYFYNEEQSSNSFGMFLIS